MALLRRCRAGLAALSIAFLGCAPLERHSPASVARAKTAPEAPKPAVEARASAWVLRVPTRGSTTRFELGPGRIGVLAFGRRWIVDERGSLAGSFSDDVTITGVQPIEKGAGGGFLFFSTAGLYRAPTFDGALVPLSTFQVLFASGGPGFVLASMSDGTMQVLSGDGSTKPSPRLPLGAQVLRTAGDGTVAVIAHGGHAYLSRDGAKSFTEITADVGMPIGLDVIDDHLYVLDASGDAVRVDGGALARSPLPRRPKPPLDPDWNRSDSPLEAAVSRGVAIDDDRLVFTDGGTVYEVSARTGRITRREPGVLPPRATCTPIATSAKTVFACVSSDASSVYARSHHGGETRLEKTFDVRGLFHKGAGDALMFRGPCKGITAKPGLVCSRSSDGAWHSLDRSSDLEDTSKHDPLKVLAWVPKEDGALLIVGGKGGGIWDARSGAKVALDEDTLKRIEPLLPSSDAHVNDRLGVSALGEIVGLGRDSVGFKLSDGGKRLERSPFRFSSLTMVGSLAFAWEASPPAMWQSKDYGFTYTQIDGPPGPAMRENVRSCSAAGCVLNQWIRVGWEAEPAQEHEPMRSTAGVRSLPAPRPPQLQCESKGPLVLKQSSKPDQTPGFGAESVRAPAYLGLFLNADVPGLDSYAFRAATGGKVATLDAGDPGVAPRGSRTVRYLEPFDPKGTIHKSTIPLSDLSSAAMALGTSPPDPYVDVERGHSIPTLGDSPGVLLFGVSGPAIWARSKSKPLPVAYVDDGSSPTSAIELGNDELAILRTSPGQPSVVLSVGPGRSNELFQIPSSATGAPTPPHPDALARGADGKLGIIRLPTEGPPTKSDPALLLRPGEAPVALAPWSTLEIDGSASCEGMSGHRAILTLSKPWLSVGQLPQDYRDHPSLVLVRWSETQLCVEAVETFHASRGADARGDAAIVARFGKNAGASELMIFEGMESKEPRSCVLVR